MFNNIKSKIQNVQKDISVSLKHLKLGDNLKSAPAESEEEISDFNAGSDLLYHYQQVWKILHNASEENAKEAEAVDSIVSKVSSDITNQWNEIKKVNEEICIIPEITHNIQNIMASFGEIESLVEDVQSGLFHLENLIDIERLLENKNNKKSSLQVYKRRKSLELEALRNSYETKFQEKMRIKSLKRDEILKQRQEIFMEAFEEEMNNYKVTGQLNYQSSSKQMEPSHQLNDIELDQDSKLLDEFLADSSNEDTEQSDKDIPENEEKDNSDKPDDE